MNNPFLISVRNAQALTHANDDINVDKKKASTEVLAFLRGRYAFAMNSLQASENRIPSTSTS
jgi:hypothetical protein